MRSIKASTGTNLAERRAGKRQTRWVQQCPRLCGHSYMHLKQTVDLVASVWSTTTQLFYIKFKYFNNRYFSHISM